MASRARKIIDEKIESLKLLTGNQDLVVKYSGGKYALLEEWTSCFHRVLGSSGYYDMTASKYKTLSKHQKGILKKLFINNQIRGEKFIEGLKKINSTMSDEEIEDTFNTL